MCVFQLITNPRNFDLQSGGAHLCVCVLRKTSVGSLCVKLRSGLRNDIPVVQNREFVCNSLFQSPTAASVHAADM